MQRSRVSGDRKPEDPAPAVKPLPASHRLDRAFSPPRTDPPDSRLVWSREVASSKAAPACSVEPVRKARETQSTVGSRIRIWLCSVIAVLSIGVAHLTWNEVDFAYSVRSIPVLRADTDEEARWLLASTRFGTEREWVTKRTLVGSKMSDRGNLAIAIFNLCLYLGLTIIIIRALHRRDYGPLWTALVVPAFAVPCVVLPLVLSVPVSDRVVGLAAHVRSPLARNSHAEAYLGDWKLYGEPCFQFMHWELVCVVRTAAPAPPQS